MIVPCRVAATMSATMSATRSPVCRVRSRECSTMPVRYATATIRHSFAANYHGLTQQPVHTVGASTQRRPVEGEGMSPAAVLVIGASGNVGSALIDELIPDHQAGSLRLVA